MKTIKPLSIPIILLTCFLQGCTNMSSEKGNFVNLRKIFENFIISSCRVNSSVLDKNRKHPIVVDFYKIDNQSYVRVSDFPGISFKGLKGYCEYENYIILYYGVNDSLANRYLDIRIPDENKMIQEYCDVSNDDVDLRDDQIRYCKIRNDTIFERFKPTKSHITKFEELLISAGLISLPPPHPGGK